MNELSCGRNQQVGRHDGMAARPNLSAYFVMVINYGVITMIYFILLLLSFFAISEFGFAVPSAFTGKCAALGIVNNTSSTSLSDNEDCRTAWVLPPTFGVASLSGYTPSGNLGLCQEVKEVQGLSHSVLLRMNQ